MIDAFLKDTYLMAGVALLLVSVVVIFWIVRSLRRKQENDAAPLPNNFSDFFTPPSSPQQVLRPPVPLMPSAPPAPSQVQTPASSPSFTVTAPAPPISVAAPASLSPSAPGVSAASLQNVVAQLEKIEARLNAITERLDHPSAQGASPQDSAQISDLSKKIEKIYQVLASLSGTPRG